MENLTKIYQKLKNLLLETPMQEVKSKMMDFSMPIFAEYDRDRRDFFSKIAIMSAMIGAFSFLLFNPTSLIKNQILLKIGDCLLLGVIAISVILYLFILADSLNEFHKKYYDYLEIFIKKEYDKLPKYERLKPRNFFLEILVCSLFVVALAFIGISFI